MADVAVEYTAEEHKAGSSDATAPAKTPMVDLTVSRVKVAESAYEKQQKREDEDLRFQVPELQWPSDVSAARGPAKVGGMAVPGRPMLSVATLDEPIQLVLNQEKAADLGVNIHALTETAEDDTAAVLQSLYRAIVRDSRAALARRWAYNRAVKCGRGAYRVLKEWDYDTGTPGDQKIVIRRILYQDSVFLDPFAQEPDWSDMEWAIIITDMPWTKYKRIYGDTGLAKYNDSQLTALGNSLPGWVGGEEEASRTVRVAEHYYLEIDQSEETIEGVTPAGEKKNVRKEAPKRKVKWCLVNGIEEIDSEDWDGQYIPIIPTIGEELIPFKENGRTDRRWKGMTTNAKDGVRLTNYAASGAVEMAALEPKAPWQGEEGVFEGHEKEYEESAVRNIPYLQYRRFGLAGVPADPPARVRVDVSRMGPSMELLRMGRDFVQAATYTYDPALGKQPTAHRSGEAIKALQDQTSFGTSNYLDSLATVSIPYEAKVVLDLIPFVYDRPGRVAKILDEHGQSSSVMLNAPFTMNQQTKKPVPFAPQAGQDVAQMAADKESPVKHYDLNKGRYGVDVVIGKTSSSRLQQGSDEMGQLLQADPTLMPIVGPEYFNYRDFPGAKTISKLLKKMREAQFPFLKEGNEQDAAAKLAQAEAKMKEMEQALQEATQAVETDKAKYAAQVEIEKMKLFSQSHIQRMKSAAEIDIARIQAAAKLGQTLAESELERVATADQHMADENAAMHDRAHELGMAAQGNVDAGVNADIEAQRAGDQALNDRAHEVAMRASEPPPVAPGGGGGEVV